MNKSIFKIAVGKKPESEGDLSSQPIPSRLENSIPHFGSCASTGQSSPGEENHRDPVSHGHHPQAGFLRGRERRIIVKAEHLKKGENVRFVVTNLAYDSPAEIYHFYCQRGDMENRIEELKNHLKADRTSCTSFRANQF